MQFQSPTKENTPQETGGRGKVEYVLSKFKPTNVVLSRHSARFRGLHNPPKRIHPIPFCGEFIRSDDEDWEPVEEVQNEIVDYTLDTTGDEEKEEDNCAISPQKLNNWKDLYQKDGVKRDVVGGWTHGNFETIRMVNLNEQVVRKHPHFAMRTKAMYSVRLEKVVSPSDFFLEFILGPPNDGCATLEESLQRFYNDPDTAEKYKMRTLRPFLNQQYVFYNKDTKKWERIRVHKVDFPTESVIAFHLERIEIVRGVPIKSLFEVHPDYANWHRFPVKGELFDTLPKNPEGCDKTKWSEEACDFFKNFVKDKTYWALIAKKTQPMATIEDMKQTRSEDRFMGVQVVLFERGKKPIPPPPVNAWLIQKGYAYGEDIMSNALMQMSFYHKLKLNVEDPYKHKDL